MAILKLPDIYILLLTHRADHRKLLKAKTSAKLRGLQPLDGLPAYLPTCLTVCLPKKTTYEEGGTLEQFNQR